MTWLRYDEFDISIVYTFIELQEISPSSSSCDSLQDLLNEAQQRLANIAKNPNEYSTLLEGLVLQVSRFLFEINDAFQLFIYKEY